MVVVYPHDLQFILVYTFRGLCIIRDNNNILYFVIENSDIRCTSVPVDPKVILIQYSLVKVKKQSIPMPCTVSKRLRIKISLKLTT